MMKEEAMWREKGSNKPDETETNNDTEKVNIKNKRKDLELKEINKWLKEGKTHSQGKSLHVKPAFSSLLPKFHSFVCFFSMISVRRSARAFIQKDFRHKLKI